MRVIKKELEISRGKIIESKDYTLIATYNPVPPAQMIQMVQMVYPEPPKPGMIRNMSDTAWIDPSDLEWELNRMQDKMSAAVFKLKECIKNKKLNEAEVLAIVNEMEY